MQLLFCLLADSVNVSREGKLNVLGIFNAITASQLPAVHPQMHVVMRFEATPGEYGTTQNVEVKLIDQDGKSILAAPKQIDVPTDGGGRNVELNLMLVLNNVLFEGEGEYSIRVLVNNDEKGSLPLRVNTTG